MNFLESSGGAWVWQEEANRDAEEINICDESNLPPKLTFSPTRTVQVYESYNSRICPCDGGRHYLELMTDFDGTTGTFFRKCYKCGREWTATEKVETYKKICRGTGRRWEVGVGWV